jgi:SCP-2 sterol transfer family
MPDAITEFFDRLGRRGYEPFWARTVGNVRLELVDEARTDAWVVTIDRGNVSVSRDDGESHCGIRLARSLFEQLTRGEANAMAAVLRGDITCTGDVELLFALQRVFPGPPNQRRPAPIGRSNRWEP